MPTTFGIENTLFYIPNEIFTSDFDGFPTLISPLIGLAMFIIVSNLTPRRGQFEEVERRSLIIS